MIDFAVVDLSRLQFAATAMYHFLFVPLTLGLSFMLAIMETVYVMTGRPIWRQMTIFWGTLFGINFAMGVATGIVMEFQFGTNWSFYSHYVGDIFGAPLAIEGLMAFFLEATFVGIFFFGWDRMSKVAHLVVTYLVAIGANFSALWILIANGWMQNPVGSFFNPDTMRMEVANFGSVLFNPVAQAKFVHTVSAGYVTGAVFVLAISSVYLLRNKHVPFAKRSIAVASSFGLLASLSVVVLGDESGYIATEHQRMKVAAMEAMWETEPAPASFNLFAIPDQSTHTNTFEIRIPYVMGLIATRSLTTPLEGINQLVDKAQGQVKNGVVAYNALAAIRNNPKDEQARATFESTWKDLGYGLLLKRFRPDIENATDADIRAAAESTVPQVLPLFFSFRVMVAIGFYFIALFAASFFIASRNKIGEYRWFLHLCAWTLPLPWIAAELGWFVAEFGRQPWIIEGVLPTFYATSDLSVLDLSLSLAMFVLLYSALLIVEITLMVKTVKHGPKSFYLPGDDAASGAGFKPAGAPAAPHS